MIIAQKFFKATGQAIAETGHELKQEIKEWAGWGSAMTIATTAVAGAIDGPTQALAGALAWTMVGTGVVMLRGGSLFSKSFAEHYNAANSNAGCTIEEGAAALDHIGKQIEGTSLVLNQEAATAPSVDFREIAARHLRIASESISTDPAQTGYSELFNNQQLKLCLEQTAIDLRENQGPSATRERVLDELKKVK